MKQFLIIAILGCLGWNAQAEGTLRLLNTKFDHPQLRDWAAAHPNLVTAQLQRGLDVMGLQDAAGEAKLSQAADSLGLAHGFLTFDYRISGLLASFAEETAGKLLPEIQQKMGAEYGVGAGQPYALLITWISFQGKQLESLFYVNWQGFSRENAYSEDDKSFIKNAAAQTFYSGDEEVNGIFRISARANISSIQMATTIMKFFLLLNDLFIEDAYFMVNGKKYMKDEILIICTCIDNPIKIEVFQANNTPFPESTIWPGTSTTTGPSINFEDKATPQTSYSISAQYIENNVTYSAKLSVVVIKKIDYKESSTNFFFDNNEIKGYAQSNLKEDIVIKPGWQYELSMPSFDLPKRWTFLLAGQTTKVSINTVPLGAVKEIITNLGSTSKLSGSEIEIFSGQQNPYSNGKLYPNYPGCEKYHLGVYNLLLPKNENIKIVIIDEENDDVQVTEKGNEGAVCITAGPNSYLDTKVDLFDEISLDGRSILPGGDGTCESIANNTNVPCDISLDVINSAKIKIIDLYKKVGVNLNFLGNIERKTINYDRNRDGKLTQDAGFQSPADELARIHEGKNTIVFVSKIADKVAKNFSNEDVIAYSDFLHGGYIAMDASNIKNSVDGLTYELAKAIGHYILSLEYDLSKYKVPPTDPENLILGKGMKLRKFQWAKIYQSEEEEPIPPFHSNTNSILSSISNND
jgi:hypothetical protein